MSQPSPLCGEFWQRNGEGKQSDGRGKGKMRRGETKHPVSPHLRAEFSTTPGGCFIFPLLPAQSTLRGTLTRRWGLGLGLGRGWLGSREEEAESRGPGGAGGEAVAGGERCSHGPKPRAKPGLQRTGWEEKGAPLAAGDVEKPRQHRRGPQGRQQQSGPGKWQGCSGLARFGWATAWHCRERRGLGRRARDRAAA